MQLMIIAVAYITAGSWCGSKIAAIVFLGDSGNLSAIRLRCTTLPCRRLAVGTSCNTGLCRTTLPCRRLAVGTSCNTGLCRTTLTCCRLAVGTSCNTGLCRTTLTICACLRPAALTICTRLRPTALACRRLY